MTPAKAGCAFCLALLLTITSVGSQAGAKEEIDYQKIADSAEWDWIDEMSNPLDCIRKSGNKYDIHLHSKKDDRNSLSILILSEGREVYAWKGHPYSVFRILDDRLYYARFDLRSTGGVIVAVDLTTGKELWASELKALGLIEHSKYFTFLNLDCDGAVVSIHGNESAGKYIEFKRVDTGATVGHRIFPEKSSKNRPQRKGS